MFDNLPQKEPTASAPSADLPIAPPAVAPATPPAASIANPNETQFQQKLERLQEIGRAKGQKKHIFFLIGALVIIISLCVAGYIFLPKIVNRIVGTDLAQVSCSEDTLTCSTGQVLSRNLPNCEFPACPATPEPIAPVCVKKGESPDIANGGSCCAGLRAMSGWPKGYVGECSTEFASDTGIICSECGNGACDADTNESVCNCPEDCQRPETTIAGGIGASTSDAMASTSEADAAVSAEASDIAATAPIDTDSDGLTDDQEKALGTDPGKADTDGDTYKDFQEVSGGYNPLGVGKMAAEMLKVKASLGLK